MRVNVYAEEIIPDEVTIVRKTVVPNGESSPVTFYGVRLMLASSDTLHYTPDDDDRSAITFWVEWTRQRGNNVIPLTQVVSRALLALQSIQGEIAVGAAINLRD